MSSLLKNLTEILIEAQASKDEQNYLTAIGFYNTILANLASAGINDELKFLIPPVKEEMKKLIEMSLSSSRKLIVLQSIKDNAMSESKHHNDKIIQRIESTLLSKKPKVNFADVCGMETLKKDLSLALILPMKHPELFSDGREPYRAFLFFGVSLTKILVW